MASPLIRVESVDKIYRIWNHPRSRLVGSLSDRLSQVKGFPAWFRRRAAAHCQSLHKEFYALKGVSFDVHAGETVGIIGKNGSGKSTLLKLIAGTLRPTRGAVSVTGRVAAMLELAAGFEQEFTGRENVYLSASILGLTRQQVNERFDQIADFADIGQFLDQPVKTYSSGMLVRLAFAVHTAVKPEILIIDEALSVGDETFRRKCFARLDHLREQGTTILFVSHDLGSVVNLTQRALFFHQGEVVMEGKPKAVAEQYQRYCHVSRAESEKIVTLLKSGKSALDTGMEEESPSDTGNREARAAGYETPRGSAQFDPNFTSKSKVEYACHGGQIHSLRLYDSNLAAANLLQRNRTYTFEYRVTFTDRCEDVTFAMLIKTLKGHELGGSRTLPWDQFIEEVEPGQTYAIRFRFQTLLMPGVYFLNAGVEGVIEGKRSYVHRILDALPFRVLPEKDLMPTGTVDFLIEPEMEVLKDS